MVKHLIQWVVCLCLCATGINTAWATTKTLDFSFSTIGSTGWSTSYTSHEFTYDEGTVTFQAASKQTSTITDIPVTKAGYVEFVLGKGTISSVSFACRQWGSKKKTISLFTKTKDEWSSKAIATSTNFNISAENFTGVTAVKITFNNTDQIGIESLTITYDNPDDTRPAVDITTFQTTDESTKLGIYKSIGTNVDASQTGWTYATENVPFLYSSNDTTTAKIDANGVIYAKKVGKATITAKANVADGGTYQSGKSKSIEIEVVDNRKEVNLTEFTATNNDLLVDNTTTTTVSNDQSEWTPKYTYESKNTSVAEVNAEGVVTGKASGTAKIVVTANIEEKDPDFKAGKTTTKDITITVKNPSHKATFMVNGTEESIEDIEEGKSITFPTPDESQLADNLVFAGWSTSDLDSMVYNAPELVDTKNAIMGNADTTFYAVFARIAQAGTFESDTLTTEMIQTVFNDKAHAYNDKERQHTIGLVTWSAKAYNNKANNDYLQIKGSDDTYVSFETPYSINCIKLKFTNANDGNNTGKIYIKTSHTSSSASGTKLYTLEGATSSETTIKGNYTKLYIQSENALRIREITLIGDVTEPSYAGYVTDTKDANTSRSQVVTIANCGYTTVCLPYNAKAPEGATLYALKSVDSEGLHFSKTDTLAAGQGYVLQGEKEAVYTLNEVLEAVDYNANLLKGVVEQTNRVDLQLQGSGDYAYPWILAKDGSFKRYTGAYIPAGKAYLDGALLQNLQANQASALRVILEEDEVTALSQLHEEKATAPCYYNLQGQRVAQPRQAGALYIESNGRKIIVK